MLGTDGDSQGASNARIPASAQRSHNRRRLPAALALQVAIDLIQAYVLCVGLSLALLRVIDDHFWRWLRPTDVPRAGIPLLLGFAAGFVLLGSALAPLLYKQSRRFRRALPMKHMITRVHMPLAFAALALSIVHAAGHLSMEKSGDALLAGIVAITISALIGRWLEGRQSSHNRVARSSGQHPIIPPWFPIVCTQWRRAHRWLSYVVMLLFLWHLLAVAPILLPYAWTHWHITFLFTL